MNKYKDTSNCDSENFTNWLWTLEEKCEEYFVGINKLRLDFQLMQCFLKFNVGWK